MVLAIVQARRSSRRLPGKVLEPILGRTMLERQLERVRRARRLTRIVVATSVNPEDDEVAAAAATAGVETFRGDLEDVLGRFLGALEAFGGGSGPFVRLTADCPLADPLLIDEAVLSHRRSGAEYTAVQRTWSFPKGLDVEVVEAETLRRLDGLATGSDREHVTSYIHAHWTEFRTNAISRDPPLPGRWTVDEPEDLAFVRAVYADLHPRNPAFTSADVQRWVEARAASSRTSR